METRSLRGYGRITVRDDLSAELTGPVEYFIAVSRADSGIESAEGSASGNSDFLTNAYNAGHADLTLETGEILKITLIECEVDEARFVVRGIVPRPN